MVLPDSILEEAGDVPTGEAVALDILRRRLPGMRFLSLVSPTAVPPYVLVRSTTFYGAWTADRRFIREYFISIESFTEGLEAETEGPKIHMAAENAFLRAALSNESVLGGAGWIEAAELTEPVRRVSDWASATGPVQTADLPQGWARHISIHHLTLKRADVGLHIYDH